MQPSFHAAYEGPVDAHAFRDSLLAQTKGEPESARIPSKDLANVHPQDRKQSRILTLRVIIRGHGAPLVIANGDSIAEISRNEFQPSSWWHAICYTCKLFEVARCDRLFLNSIACAAVATMPKPPLDPDVADVAPSDSALTPYDEQHVVTYTRLLQAESEGADWREVARIVLHIDPEQEPDRARKAYLTHLKRAKWVTEQGRLLRGTGTK